MSDLIRREDIIKLVNQFVFDLCKDQNDEVRRTFNKYIEKMPTAYDIDKVVEELESFAKLAEDRWTNGTSKYAYQEHKCWVKAIEIVKHGGVSDDVCEWKYAIGGEFIQNPHTKILYRNEPSMKNIYCNTCGKRIKVVE